MKSTATYELALELAARMSGAWGAVSVSRFFGGFALIAAGTQFGFVMKGSLYLRVDNESRPLFEAKGMAPFLYSGASKTVTVASYYEAPSDVIEDPDLLARWAATAQRAAMTTRRTRPRVKARVRANPVRAS